MDRRELHNKGYSSRRWRRRSKLEKAKSPLCIRCEEQGRTTPAEVSHHINSFRNIQDFLTAPVLSLCRRCHELEHGRGDQKHFSKEIGLDGFPVDPAHEFNRGELRSVNEARLKQAAARRKKR
jgi:5-methylcytosine-specific restriction enzyme A